MDGISRAIGAPGRISFNGKEYLLDPLGLEDYGTIENEIIKERRDDLINLAASCYGRFPPEAAEKTRKEAFAEAAKIRSIPPEEIHEWMNTVKGLAFTVWLGLHKRHPGEIDLTQAVKIVEQMSMDTQDELRRVRDQVSGIDEAGNSTGLTSEAATSQATDRTEQPQKTAA